MSLNHSPQDRSSRQARNRIPASLGRRHAFPRRKFLQTATAALSGLALSSCGWTLAKVQTKPRLAPDKIFLYTWANYTDDDLLALFEAETGYTVEINVFDSNELMLTTLQTGRGADYSIIYPSDYIVEEMIDLDLLTELDHSRLQGLRDLFPEFQNPTYDPGNRYSVPMSWGTTGLVYNTKELSPPPEDWSYLWSNQKKLAKRMTLLNDSREVMGAVLRMLGYSYNSNNANEIKQAYEELEKLKPYIASFTTDAWRDQILAGDLLVAMCYSADAVEVIKENPDLRYVVPLSGSSLWADTLVIPKAAPNAKAGYAWINFLLQPNIAAQVSERLSFATPVRSAFFELPAEVREDPALFPSEEVVARCEGIRPVEDENEALFESYWEQLAST